MLRAHPTPTLARLVWGHKGPINKGFAHSGGREKGGKFKLDPAISERKTGTYVRFLAEPYIRIIGLCCIFASFAQWTVSEIFALFATFCSFQMSFPLIWRRYFCKLWNAFVFDNLITSRHICLAIIFLSHQVARKEFDLSLRMKKKSDPSCEVVSLSK